MEIMMKSNLSLTPEQMEQINQIEKAEDRPRTRILRRAVEEYLQRYDKAHPGFFTIVPKRMLKEGLEVDTIAFRGKKTEVVFLADGSWRLPKEEDYEELEEAGSR